MHLRYTIILHVAITINCDYEILTYQFVTAIVKIATRCKRTLVYSQTQAETFSRSSPWVYETRDGDAKRGELASSSSVCTGLDRAPFNIHPRRRN